MDNLFLILFMFSTILIPVGFIKPSILSFLFKDKISRSRSGLTIIGFTILFLFLFIATSPETSTTQQAQVNEINNADKTSEVAKNENTEITTPKKETLLVTRIIDGDTIEIETGEKVRYIGIDTPESVAPGKEVECFGKEASAKNTELVLNKEVTLEKDVSDTDQFGRLLRYVYVGEDFINETLVSEGYANAATYPPDVKYQDLFRTAEEFARSNNSGLWSACKTPEPIVTTEPDEDTNPAVVQNQTPASQQETTPVVQQPKSKYTCDCKKTCPNISSCDEAQYLLNVCGCAARDNDKDGIACDSSPLNCQN